MEKERLLWKMPRRGITLFAVLVATKRLYKRACPSVRGSVGLLVRNTFTLRPPWSDLCRVYSVRCIVFMALFIIVSYF